ncbi:MAG: coenzyme A pyrophosphatase, partial [Haloarculaceae archaeon]
MDLEGVRRHEPSTVAGQEREAAVIVPVIERPDGPALLFTKRADHLSDHPG